MGLGLLSDWLLTDWLGAEWLSSLFLLLVGLLFASVSIPTGYIVCVLISVYYR